MDVESADNTVLIARAHETLSRLLHLLQHLAATIGLALNGSKCQLLTIHASLPAFLSTMANAYATCDCPHCTPFFGVPSQESSPGPPLTPLPSAKYLGSFYITPTSSSNPGVNFCCSQASFNKLDPFSRHPQRYIPIKSQIVQSILLHGSESQVYSPAQTTKIDSLHYKASATFFRLRVHTSIGFYFLWPIQYCLLVSLPLSGFQTHESDILDTSSVTQVL